MSASTQQQNHYALLGVHKHATKEEIRTAYKNQALKLHPDKNPNGEALFKLVLSAYQVLMSPGKKSAYDREMERHESRRPAYGAPSSSNNNNYGYQRRYSHPFDGNNNGAWKFIENLLSIETY